MATVVVIDNHRDEVMLLGNQLEKAFPDWTVLPDRNRREQEPFHDWDDVLKYLLAIEDSDVVLCLDLSINQPDWEDVQRGLRWAEGFRLARPTWTFVAYTKHSQYAEGTPEFKATFDGLLEKSELVKQTSFESAVFFVRSVIEGARRRRRVPGAEMIPPHVRVVDSLGMRSFRAAFSDETLGDIIRDEAADWGPLRVESLTSGYSGAFMLALTSVPPAHSLIVKVARSEETIAHELRAQEEHLAELAPFGARFAPISSDMRRLRNGSGVYYRQMPVDGQTVLKRCLGNPVQINLSALERVTRMCMRVLRATPVRDRPIAVARKRFVLTPVDVGRLETSTAFLAEVGGALAAKELWPARLPSAEEIASEVSELARTWSENELTAAHLPEAVQHGDLNPGNVVIDAEGIPVLIDFQRLGRWPIGYDMARLAGLLRIRLTDARDRSDWLPFRFPLWCRETVEKLKGEVVLDPVCSEAEYCDREFLDYANELSEGERAVVEYGYRLGSLWDLIKIISYQDISTFKRTWALVLCWGLVQRLRRDRALLPRDV